MFLIMLEETVHAPSLQRQWVALLRQRVLRQGVAGQARNDVLIVAGSAFETTLFVLYRQTLISYAALRFASGHNS
jgi:hypothetical protein